MFFDYTITIMNSLPVYTNSNGYCGPKNWVLTQVLKIYDVQMIRFCSKWTIDMYVKAKNFLHTIRLSSPNYVFIVFLDKSNAKIYNVSLRVVFSLKKFKF